MAFLTLNGVNLPVLAHAEPQRQSFLIDGDDDRAPSGNARRHDRGEKLEWKFNLKPMRQTLARAFRGLIKGDGHHWSFEDASTFLYSDRGLGPTVNTSNSRTGGAFKHGAFSLAQHSGSSVLTYTVGGLLNGWTAMIFRDNGSSMDHYLVRSDGSKWVNGSNNNAANTTFLVVNANAGTVTLQNDASWTSNTFDDFVVLPYLVPDDWPALMYAAHNVAAWSSLPKLNASGDFSPFGTSGGAAFSAIGKVMSAKIGFAVDSGVRRNNAEWVEFVLREV